MTESCVSEVLRWTSRGFTIQQMFSMPRDLAERMARHIEALESAWENKQAFHSCEDDHDEFCERIEPDAVAEWTHHCYSRCETPCRIKQALIYIDTGELGITE